MDADELLARVRALAMVLPHVTERDSHGSPSWFVGRAPMFASWDDHHHGADHVAVWAAAPDGVQHERVRRDPEVWFAPPYVGGRGWVGMRLGRATDWDEVADLLDEAWDVVAPPRARS